MKKKLTVKPLFFMQHESQRAGWLCLRAGNPQSLGGGSIQVSKWNPHALIDLYASFQLIKNASFDLNIDNLTDRYYVDALSTMPQPGPGRTLRGSVTLKF
ncbi:TonB-dependent receptor [Pantoea coffeiphila]|uniref:Uncharacterized protein n=1 Tax=Pantoea coffeiphila TaxID=1465635 RepID=A0A2S9IG18_9GAMM|nr:TonB-dependent receptor [Pantoea coffeiphila]PRD16684.1 hypothetical protein CQW29_03195 [Pantoea coffeiphila]